MHRRASSDVLAAALRDAHRALSGFTAALALAEDPLRLALPVLPGSETAAPSRDQLGAWAALYLQAELEEAGVLPAVEALAAQRHALQLNDRAAAARLDRLAWTARDYPSHDERTALFAQLFGFGVTPLRLDFPQRLLRLATAVVRADLERQRHGHRPGPGLISRAAWQAAAQDLLAAVAAAPAGSLLNWARRIHAHLLQAFELLGDAGLMRQLGSRSAWDSLGRLLPEDGAARRDAAARRGAAGQQLLRGLADMPGAEVPDAVAVQAALRWLAASGLPVPIASLPPPAAPPGLPDTAFARSSSLSRAAIERARSWA